VQRRRPWPVEYVRAAHHGLVPGVSFLFSQMYFYLRPGFHPSTMGDISKAVRYLAVSPAAQAAHA